MVLRQQHTIRNRLLSCLSADDFLRLQPHLEPIDLPRLFALSAPNQLADFSYFLEAGIGSIVAASAGNYSAEIGIFGREGMSPTAVILNAGSAPFSIFMQVPGHGYRIQSIQLALALNESFTLRNLLSRYVQTVSVQTAFTALSNATRHIEERLARWILMCHDRVDGDSIALTHDFLSIMLAVRRQSVTTALHMLEGKHLISADRGLVTIRNRRELELFAGDSYGQPEAEYRRLIGVQ
jgi:CRP-like cAMP-binding protein